MMYNAGDKYNKFPKRKRGEHLWVMAAIFKTVPIQQDVIMDHENLINIDGPGCFWCEQMWKPGLENSWCNGKP